MLHLLQSLLQRVHLLSKVQPNCIQALLKLGGQITANRLDVLTELLPLVPESAINHRLEIVKIGILLSKSLLLR